MVSRKLKAALTVELLSYFTLSQQIVLLNAFHVKAALAVKCVISESTWLLKIHLFMFEARLLNCIIKISSLMNIV